MEIGERLKAARKNHGMSQRELAKVAGVTNRTISLIEKNQVSPSIGSLKKILDAMSVTLSDFFSSDVQEKRKEKFWFDIEEQPDMGSGGLHYFLIAANQSERKLEILREVMPPGSDTGEDLLSHEGEEGGVIIQGNVEITVDGVTRKLGPGDGYYFKSTQPHRFKNTSKKEVIIISACTPSTF
jgi:transcriptional regulator with XRE-family HTH domain